MNNKMKIDDLKGSVSLLMSAMVDAGRQYVTENFGVPKPTWLTQTEKFESFFLQLTAQEDSKSAIDGFKRKFTLPFFQKSSVEFMKTVVTEQGNVKDYFMRITDEDSGKISRVPRGFFWHCSETESLKSLYLPISEAYTSAVKHSEKHGNVNVSIPVRILLGFYSSLFYSIRDTEDFYPSSDDLEFLSKTVKDLNEFLESIGKDDEEEEEEKSTPMGFLNKALGGFSFDKLGEMMGKITENEEMNKEFQSAMTKMTESLQSGKSPLDVMQDALKQAKEQEASAAASGPIESQVSDVQALE